MPLDYEAEYDNRKRVPEHPKIFARWAKDAPAYRDQASHAGRAELDLSYGPSKRETIDLFRSGKAGAPLALFIHGGYWRSLEPAMFSHMARGLNAHGVDVGVAGYDLCPQVTIAQIIDQMRAACLFLWHKLNKRVMVYGHSAGGHLAAAMLATDWHARHPEAPNDLVPVAYSISGVFDLAPLVKHSMNADLRLDENSARDASPLFWPVARGRVLDAVVGGDESSEFLRQSQVIVDAWRQGPVETRYEAFPGANHFTVIDPLADPDSKMVARLLTLCERTEKGA